MKEIKNKYIPPSKPGMFNENDFTGKEGGRVENSRPYQQGQTVKVTHDDGSDARHDFTLADGAVILEPDGREYFPRSKGVNQVRRSLIALTPGKLAKPTAASKKRA